MTTAYPLTWPAGYPREKSPMASKFKTTLASALHNVEDSIRRFSIDSNRKVANVIISSNYSLSEQRPNDPAVAVYFTWDGISTCIAVDRYKTIAENLQAIHHVIEAERTKLRHGGLNIVRAAFRGYAALPPPTGNVRPWRKVMGFAEGAEPSPGVLQDVYRRLANEHHPDKGGDPGKMSEMNAAIEDACKELGR